MAVIKVTQFGGELPRVPARNLPPQAAQVNQNLLATASEFRPLEADSTLTATATSGAKSLYRLSRDNAGALRTSAEAGWLTDAVGKNYVKGQLNDDATERTYVSTFDGSAQLRVINAQDADRQLGIPAPAKPTVTLNAATQFTAADAEAWITASLIPGVCAAIQSSLTETNPAFRYTASPAASIAGPYDLVGMSLPNVYSTVSQPWELTFRVLKTTAVANGLNDPGLSAVDPGDTYLYFTIACLPAWAIMNTGTLSTALGALSKQDNITPLFPSAKLAGVVADVFKMYDPDLGDVKTKRNALGVLVKAFKDGIDFVLSAVGTPPTEPTKPTTAEYVWDAPSQAMVRDAAWVTYDAALIAYKAALKTYNESQGVTNEQKVARIALMIAAKAQATVVQASIEKIYTDRMANRPTWVKKLLEDFGMFTSASNPNGLLTIDPDRIIDTRFYVVTFVDDWGGESAPSPVSDMLEPDQNDTVTITRPSVPASRDLAKWRIYRSNVGNNSVPFQRVAECLVSVTTYIDSKKGAELGGVIETLTWLEPPVRASGTNPYLRGLVGIPGGSMAGFMDNFVAFCEPYKGYAWPVEYQIPLQFPIVGLGVFGQTVFVGTLANPYLISGSDPASMSAIKLDNAQACSSARSIVSTLGGVLYASPDGICFASAQGVELITGDLFAREDWQALTPSSMFAAMHEGVYYFWYAGTYQGVTGGCFALDTVAKKLCRMADMTATAVFEDILTDALFYVSGTAIKRAFATSRRTGAWRSGILILPSYTGFAWLQVDHDLAGTVTVQWYGDGTIRHTAIVSNNTPVRLPAGKYLEHEVVITSTARVTKVLLASSLAELQSA